MFVLLLTMLISFVATQTERETPDPDKLKQIADLLAASKPVKLIETGERVEQSVLDFHYTPPVGFDTTKPHVLDESFQLSNKQMESLIKQTKGKKIHQLTLNTGVLKFPLNKPIDYNIDPQFDPLRKAIIRQMMDVWQSETCLRFTEKPYVPTPGLYFAKGVDGGTCSSYTGNVGINTIWLSPYCFDRPGRIAHEIMHSLGFFHEQQRFDSDKYVTYDTANILPGLDVGFIPAKADKMETFGTPYDHGSITHFSMYSATKNGGITVSTKNFAFNHTIGQRLRPSFVDAFKVNKAYCQANCTDSQLKCENGGYPDVNNCQICKCPSGFGGNLCETVEGSDSGCGGVLHINSDSLQKISLFNATKGQLFRRCNWLFSAPVGFLVELKFAQKFDLPCQANLDFVCEKSYLEIKILKDLRSTGFRLCCSPSPSDTFKSKGPKLILMYRNEDPQSFKPAKVIIFAKKSK